MANKGNKEVEKLKGFSKYFNSVTIDGRANVSNLTSFISFKIDIFEHLYYKKILH